MTSPLAPHDDLTSPTGAPTAGPRTTPARRRLLTWTRAGALLLVVMLALSVWQGVRLARAIGDTLEARGELARVSTQLRDARQRAHDAALTEDAQRWCGNVSAEHRTRMGELADQWRGADSDLQQKVIDTCPDEVALVRATLEVNEALARSADITTCEARPQRGTVTITGTLHYDGPTARPLPTPDGTQSGTAVEVPTTGDVWITVAVTSGDRVLDTGEATLSGLTPGTDATWSADLPLSSVEARGCRVESVSWWPTGASE